MLTTIFLALLTACSNGSTTPAAPGGSEGGKLTSEGSATPPATGASGDRKLDLQGPATTGPAAATTDMGGDERHLEDRSTDGPARAIDCASKSGRDDNYSRPDQYDEGALGYRSKPDMTNPTTKHFEGVVLSLPANPKTNNIAHLERTFWVPKNGVGASTLSGVTDYGGIKGDLLVALDPASTLDVDVACEIGPLVRPHDGVAALRFRTYATGAKLSELKDGSVTKGCRLSKQITDSGGNVTETWEDWAYAPGVLPAVGNTLGFGTATSATVDDYKACVGGLGASVVLFSDTMITKKGKDEAPFSKCSWMPVDDKDFGGGDGSTEHPVPAPSDH